MYLEINHTSLYLPSVILLFINALINVKLHFNPLFATRTQLTFFDYNSNFVLTQGISLAKYQKQDKNLDYYSHLSPVSPVQKYTPRALDQGRILKAGLIFRPEEYKAERIIKIVKTFSIGPCF